MYEIARLINHVISGSESKKREIVEKLGYKEDLYKGYSRLRGLMQTGRCEREIRENLPQALGIDKKFVEEALHKTDKKLQKQQQLHKSKREQLARNRFRPYLWIEHEYDHILTKSYIDSNNYNQMKIIELPDSIDSFDWEDQLKIIRRYINMNQKSNLDKRLGKIRNYIYFKDVEESYLFDTYGGLIKIETEQHKDLIYAVI